MIWRDLLGRKPRRRVRLVRWVRQCRAAVLPVGVGADPIGLEESDLVVVAQRAAGGAGDAGDVLDGPVHRASLLVGVDPIVRTGMMVQVDVASMSILTGTVILTSSLSRPAMALWYLHPKRRIRSDCYSQYGPFLAEG